MWSIECVLEQCLDNLRSWSDENGFQFLKSKTVCMYFCQKRSLHLDPELSFGGAVVLAVDKVKFLGLVFEKKK